MAASAGEELGVNTHGPEKVSGGAVDVRGETAVGHDIIPLPQLLTEGRNGTSSGCVRGP